MTSLSNSSTLEYSGSRRDENQNVLGLSLSSWVAMGIVSLLMMATFRFNLVRLWGKTNPFTGESEWSHAIVVPVLGLYYLYLHKEELLRAKVVPVLVGGFTRGRLLGAAGLVAAGLIVSVVGPLVAPVQTELARMGGYLLMSLAVLVMALNWGLAMMVFGLLFFGYGIWPGQNDYFKDLGMVCTLFGVVLTLCGWDVMKIAWFPIAYLICALPWPGLFYSWVALPLQELAATIAANLLAMTGIDAFHSGSKIHIGGQTLNVAEACAGLKSLMTFVTVGAAVAFLSSRPLWQKLLMTFSAVPIAIICNVLRVTVQGLLHHHAGPEWSENFAHQFVGMVMLVPAFFLILLMGWVLDQLFVEEADEETTAAATATARAAAITNGTDKDLIIPAPTPSLDAVVAMPANIPVRTVKANAAAAIEERSKRDNANGPVAVPSTARTPATPTARNPGATRGRGFVPPTYVPPANSPGSSNGNGSSNAAKEDRS